MNKSVSVKIFLSFVLVLLVQVSFAGGYQVLKKQDDVTISYKTKLIKETNEQAVYLKLVNKSGAAHTFDLEIGFYDNGVLQSSSNISNCLKNGIIPQIHAITDHEVAEKLDNTIEIKLISLTLTPIDECRETNSE